MNRAQRIVDRAPGLPTAPQGGFGQFEQLNKQKLAVSSVNFDYIPGALESPRSLWVELATPPPSTLTVGTPVRLSVGPNSSGSRFHNLLFEIDDIIGGKIVLLPYKQQAHARPWLPTFHSAPNVPDFESSRAYTTGTDPYRGERPGEPRGHGEGLWGYDLRTVAVSPSMHHSYQYGYGVPSSYLEFTPMLYTNRATQLQATRMKEGWYDDYPIMPGWKSWYESQLNQYS